MVVRSRDSFVSYIAQKAAKDAAAEDDEEEYAGQIIEGWDDDENWPIWVCIVDDDTDKNSKPNISECERIVPVPEIAFAEEDDAEEKEAADAKKSAFDCFNPWNKLTERSARKKSVPIEGDMPTPPARLPGRKGGVIKRTSMASQKYMGMPIATRTVFQPATYRNRELRSSFAFASGKKKFRSVRFNESKRVLKMEKIRHEEAQQVWYSYEDFDRFKLAMRVLIRAEEGPAEYTKQCLGLDVVNVSEEKERPPSIPRSISSDKLKWWHEYDHSRRGLERYANPNQARQIIAATKMATRKVLEEQTRQGFCVPRNNPKKISAVYREYSAWSRDLALAFGASDADAVSTDFDEDTRKSREHYLLKQMIASKYKIHKRMPQFMVPALTTPKGFIDETISTYFVSKANKLREEVSQLEEKDFDGPVHPSLAPLLETDDSSEEGSAGDVHLIDKSTGRKSMTKMATGFPFIKK